MVLLLYISTGTAWIVDKVNRNDDGDYKYLIATNLHVCSCISDYGNGENKDYVFCISEDIVNLKNNGEKTKKLTDCLDIMWPVKLIFI